MKNDKRISMDIIERWLDSDQPLIRAAALNACKDRDIPIEMIKKGMNDNDCWVRYYAMLLCKDREVPIEIIERGLKDEHPFVRASAITAYTYRDIPIKVIEQGLKDDNIVVRHSAMKACIDEKVPPEVIDQGVKDDMRLSHAAAFKSASQVMDPTDIIKSGICGDTVSEVCVTAMEICKKRGIPLPIIRTVEPPETVYQKCIGGVIVCASIPKDAQVRGTINDQCRSNKAIITDIIGDLEGEKIGIPRNDDSVSYFIGDEINDDNFDMNNRRKVSGFCFYCTKKLAETY